MLPEIISRNSRPISQLFRFLTVFGIDRFTLLAVDSAVIRAKIGWPSDGSDRYDADEEIQEVSWSVDHDPVLGDALWLLQELSMREQICSDKITASESEILALVAELNLARNSLEKLLSIRVDMLDGGTKTDFFFVHL
ncbi:MAG: hypothetical protein JJ911_19555 [Rhizobiaceae bacterium]|nr:hypothetical protein [Rhizobiaceae bacterium]